LFCILVVEDDRDISLVVNYFDGPNNALLSRPTADMVRHFGQIEPSLVILDLKLGRRMGSTSCARSVALQRPRNITTVHHRDENRPGPRGYLAPMITFQTVHLRELLALVRQFCGGGSGTSRTSANARQPWALRAGSSRSNSSPCRSERRASPLTRANTSLLVAPQSSTRPLSRVTFCKRPHERYIFDPVVTCRCYARRKLGNRFTRPRYQPERVSATCFILPVERF